eukprot:TRINITY_DN39175_c0_g1_i1.p1 TRINITY_DN39175_c0_g1~~TRINITY_DN39175_c0_g1_i1.p1  ORF type:complete len:330 (+),score=142.85 TRINITY_DN39175_c0_g1_i1:69-1058(+)
MIGAVAVGLAAFVPAARKYGIPTRHLGRDVHGESVDMPLVGIGSWQYNSSEAYAATLSAFQLSAQPYRHVDCAYDYFNQDGVGKALKETGLKREEFFVTSKVEGGLSPEKTESEAMSDLKDLGLDYVDLLLVHFPCSVPALNGSKAIRQAQWAAMEKLYNAGKARAIGVSHFCERHMNDVLETATVKPMVDQVQYHVGMGSAGVNATDITFKYARDHGVVFQSFSPLCGPCCMGQPASCTLNKELLTGALVTGIGAKYNKTGAQVSLKWQVQQGIPVIPKSSNPAHQAQNIGLFDFELSAEDMATLSAATSPPVAGGGSTTASGDCTLP